MSIKEKIKEVNELVSNSNNKLALAKLSEAKGLYKAYELSHSVEVLEEVINKLLDVVKATVSVPSSNTEKAKKNKNNNEGELADFYQYLIKIGKKPTTADNYRKALKQVMNQHKLKDVYELKSRINEMISKYDGNDQKAHNVHTASLRQFSKYIESNLEYILYIEKENAPDTLNYHDYNGTKDYLEEVWRGKCSENEAVSKFLEFDNKKLNEFNVLKLFPKWRPIALYNSDGRLIIKES